MNAIIEHQGQAPAKAPKVRKPAAVPALPAAATPLEVLHRAIESGASVEMIEKLMALQERWEATEARKAFDAAMADAKSEIPVIVKNRTVDFTSTKGRTHYRHEDLAGIASQVDPILARHGLSYRFRVSSEVGQPVQVTCIISHRMGHSEETTLMAGRDDSGNKNSIQQVGSTITYLQRYTLKAALGLAAAHDDDGKNADAEDADIITAEQAAELDKLMDEVGANRTAFYAYKGITELSLLPAADYATVKAQLEAKRRPK